MRSWYNCQSRISTQSCSVEEFVYAPPTATDVAVNRLCRNFHLYSFNLHLLIVSHLMTSRWIKKLNRFLHDVCQ